MPEVFTSVEFGWLLLTQLPGLHATMQIIVVLVVVGAMFLDAMDLAGLLVRRWSAGSLHDLLLLAAKGIETHRDEFAGIALCVKV